MTAGQHVRCRPCRHILLAQRMHSGINYKFNNNLIMLISRQPCMVTKEAQTVTTEQHTTLDWHVQMHMSDLTSRLKSWRTKSQLRSRPETVQELRA